jgi:hypothetical protein
MPLFARKGGKYIGALQCGAGLDAYLEFELSKEKPPQIEMYSLKPIKYGLSGGVDPEKIKKSAIEGALFAYKETGVRYFLKSIGYVPNDSRHYDLYSRIVCSTIIRVCEGGEFTDKKAR